MARLIRIDSELVRRGLARSRDQAARFVTDGRVTLDGAVVLKPARQVDPARAIEIIDPGANILAVYATSHPFPLNLHFGTLAVGLGSFPFDYGTYLS